jgi:transcriptional regulator with GAF, ATPase, and Fis domain
VFSPDIDERLRFETLVADLAAEFVHLLPDQVDGAIEDAQRRIVEALDLDRSTLFQFVDAEGTLFFTHAWSRPEGPPSPKQASGALFPWCQSQLFRGQIVCFSSVDDLPAERAERETIRQFGVKSNVTIPLVVAGRTIGALAFGMSRHERLWPPELVNRLRLIAQVFANALARKRSDEDLRGALAEVQRLRDQLRDENQYLRREVSSLHGASLVTGRSQAVQEALDAAARVAPTGTTVLLTGETGTGKELFAAQIHDLSPRRDCVMVRVNCAAIPAALIESELFGREKGAYTGALARQAGRFEVADRSTIFLDEIGELPLDLQVKLLRVLQEREFERLGSSKPVKVDVRIIAATNRDLERAVEEGTFRQDLYYRLNVFPIRVPPLRERGEDLPLLVWSFVEEFSKAFGKRIESIPKDNMLALQRYSWPGNVRELRNVIERAMIVATGPRLTIELPPSQSSATPRESVALTDIEREHIRDILERTKWRVRGAGGAAELLGMKPSTLESRMAKLGLRRRQ